MVFAARHREAIDDYVATILESTTTSVTDQDEDTDEQIAAYYTSSDRTRLLFLATSAFAILTAVWHMLFLVGIDVPYLRGVRFTISHLLLFGVLIFLSTLSTDENRRRRYLYNAYTVALILALVASTVYVFLQWDVLHLRAGLPNQADVVVSTALVLITLEGARRIVGLPFVLLGAATLAYGLFGNYVPGALGHGGVSFTRLVTSVAVPNLAGVFGFFMELSARLITIFIFFGIFLLHLGGSRFFGDFAMKVAGRFRSGPAQVAIISSGFMGMLSGSAIANVAATGSFSIPLMKRLGYDRNFAGAVESVASTGGQITPPIMGATAFIMAAIIEGTTYLDVVVAAAIPAMLYYLSVSVTAHIRAVRLGFEPIDQEEQVDLGSLLVRSYLFVPVLVIIYVLVQGANAEIAGWRGLQALVVLFGAYTLVTHREALREGVTSVVVTLLQACDSAARSMAAIMIVIAEIAWIVEVFQMTGVLQTIASTMLRTAQSLAAVLPVGELLILAVLAALVCIAFGFGAPTIVAYLFVALLATPAMTQLGVVDISAHMFVFYFAILSAISPPVAGACLVSCGISKGSFLRTCAYAMRFALPAYLLPVLWLYEPALIAQGTPTEIVMAVVPVLVAIVVVVSAFENFLLTGYTLPERLLAFVAATALVVPMGPVKLGGVVLLGVLLFVHVPRYLERRTAPLPVPWA